MKVGAAALFGGIFGVVGTLCFLVAFGTDYWLLASDNCGPFEWPTETTTVVNNAVNTTEIPPVTATAITTATVAIAAATATATASPPLLTLHHEGFFWRCAFQVEPTADAVLATFFTNQPESKQCIRGYLFPLPIAIGTVPHPDYDSTAVFRGFWTLLIILGLASALAGGFLLLCGVPFISHRLYKLGGAFLIAAACLFLFLLLLYVLWVEVVDVRRYVLQEALESCADPDVSVLYGLSFMAAAAGVPLELVSGLVFLLAGRALRASK